MNPGSLNSPQTTASGDSFDNLESGFAADETGLGAVGAARRRKPVRDGTIILAVIIFIAAGILASMRLISTKAGGYARDVALETRIDEFISGMKKPAAIGSLIVNDTEIIESLADDRTDVQVPLVEVKKNPFLMKAVPAQTPVGLPNLALTPEQIAEQKRREREASLRTQAAAMHFSSVMGSPGNYLAVIDGRVVQVGDTLPGGFTVADIGSTQVTLEAEGLRLPLKLGAAPGPKPIRRK